MTEQARALWTYRAREDILCIKISHDGRFVFAACKDEALYCFTLEGHLLWRNYLEGIPCSLALADDCERMLVGCTSGKAYLCNYQGQILHIFQTTGIVYALAITAVAHYVALGVLEGTVTFWEGNGTLLWEQTIGIPIRHLSLSADGQRLAMGDTEHFITLFDVRGAELWRYEVQASIEAGVFLSTDGSMIVAGSRDTYVYCLTRAGKLRWRADLASGVQAIALTPAGDRIVASDSDGAVVCFDGDGKRVWDSQASDSVYLLAADYDGHYVASGLRNHRVVLLDERGQALWTEQMQQQILCLAITPDGRLVASGAHDGAISLVENLGASKDTHHMRLAHVRITRLRTLMNTNPHQAVAAWFDMFDQTLLQRDLNLCRILLQKMQSRILVLHETEQGALISREGALLLFEGLIQHALGNFEAARAAYEQSKTLQHQLKNTHGEGQALSALQALEQSQNVQVPIIQTLLVQEPHLLENGTLLLTQRLSIVPPEQQYNVVLAARELGYLETLLSALASPVELVQNAASVALTWLQPGPPIERILSMLDSPLWMVRWQAARLLKQRVEQMPVAFAPYHERVRQKISLCLSQEQDPLILAVLVQVLRFSGNGAQEALLLPLLANSDPDVRLMAAHTSGYIGTRQALPVLGKIVDGQGIMGRSIADSAALARQRIRQRIAYTQVQQVILSHVLADDGQPLQPTQQFLTYTMTIYCTVTLNKVIPGTKVTCIVRRTEQADQAPMSEEKFLELPSSTHTKSASEAQQRLREWIYRLLAQDDELFWTWYEDEGDEDRSTTTTFTFTPPRGTWFPGVYVVEIALNNKIQQTQSFRIIQRDALVAAPINYQKGLFFHTFKRYQEALVSYEWALKFDVQYPEAWCNKGDALITRNQLQEASECYKHALQLDIDATVIHFFTHALQHLLESNFYGDTLAVLCQALLCTAGPVIQLDFSSTFALLCDVGQSALLHKKDAALPLLKQITLVAPHITLDYYARALAFALLGQEEDALEAVEKLQGLVSNKLLSTLMSVSCLLFLKHKEDAFALLDRALYEKPDAIPLLLMKVLVYVQTGDYTEALVLLDEVQPRIPGHLVYTIGQLFLLHHLQRTDDFFVLNEKVFKDNPASIPLRVLKGIALVLLNGEKEAILEAEEMLDADDTCIAAQLLKLWVLYRLNDHRALVAWCSFMQKRLPNFALSFIVQARSYEVLERHEEAVAAWGRAAQLGFSGTEN